MTRPEHPDLWLLSEILIDNDAQADNGTATFEDILGRYADPASAGYMAKERGLRASDRITDPQTLASAAWLDGFLVGMEFQARRPKMLQEAAARTMEQWVRGRWPEAIGFYVGAAEWDNGWFYDVYSLQIFMPEGAASVEPDLDVDQPDYQLVHDALTELSKRDAPLDAASQLEVDFDKPVQP